MPGAILMFLSTLRKFTYALTKFPSHLRKIRQETSPARLEEKRKASVKAVLEYIIHVAEDIKISDMEEELQAVGSADMKEAYMTLAEQLIAKGKDEGKLEGQTLAKQQVLLRLLEKKFGPVDDAVERKIRNCRDLDRLDQAIDLVLDSDSSDRVLQSLG